MAPRSRPRSAPGAPAGAVFVVTHATRDPAACDLHARGDCHCDTACPFLNTATAAYCGAADLPTALSHRESLDSLALTDILAALDSATDECRPPVDCLARAKAKREGLR